MKRIGILAICAAMSGCATTIGDPEFSCKGYSEAGYSCKSAREVYELTNNSGGAVTDLSEDGANHEGHDHAQGSGSMEYQQRARVQPPEVLSGPTPIRTQAKVMRVWVNSYEDKAGALHSPQLVYNEIEKRKWRFGNQAKDRVSAQPTVRSAQPSRPAGAEPTPEGE